MFDEEAFELNRGTRIYIFAWKSSGARIKKKVRMQNVTEKEPRNNQISQSLKVRSKTSNKNLQLVCNIAAKKRVEYLCSAFYHPRIKPVLAANQFFEGYEKLLQKVESSSTFCNIICTCCAFYQPKPNLFCSKWRNFCLSLPRKHGTVRS